jgi:hypothetical protein
MNKQKMIQDIEDNKGKYGYLRGRIVDGIGMSYCTIGLLCRINNVPLFLGKEDEMKKIYDMNDQELGWIAEQNDFCCHSFDCMIEKIQGYTGTGTGTWP